MKRLIILSWICLLANIGNCQVAAIQILGNTGSFFECVDNPVAIVVENCRSRSVRVSIDSGSITRSKGRKNINYLVHPAHEGYAVITVKKKKKTIATKQFKVNPFPFTVELNGKTGGEIDHRSFVVQTHLSASMGLDIQGNFPILSYSVIINRKNEAIFKRIISDSRNGKIDSVTQDFFYSLQNNDSVFFKDIIIKGCNGTPRKSDQSLAFKIIEAEKYRKSVHYPGEEVEIVDPITGETIKKRY